MLKKLKKKRYDLIIPDELRIDKMESRPEKYRPEFGREEQIDGKYE